MKRFVCLGCIAIFCLPVLAQREPDKTYMPAINGIKLFLSGNQLSYPVIELGASNALELDFDDLDAKIKNYSYTYQLCNADWQPADLSEMDYIQGFLQNRINQYRNSSVAEVKYIHYQVSLPEKSCMPSKAGNYLLKVFLNGDTGKLAFTRRLLIVQNLVPVAVQILQPYNSALFRTHQKVQFTIDKAKLDIFNPQQQLKVVVLQNYRWDNAVTAAQPVFMRQNLYEYNGEKDFIFPAGKEYRWADLRSFRYFSARVDDINRNTVPNEIYLKPDPERTHERILAIQDLNGFFEISSTDVNNAWWQGDYANVHFTFLPEDHQPFINKDVYVLGQMTNNKINDSTKLTYNADKGVYEKTLLLKQGYYSYIYVTKDTNIKDGKAETTYTEANFSETENTYTVLVYYQSLGGRSDELVGAVTVSSRTGKKAF